MRVFATFNIKGGVGKTAAAVNLAWLSAQGGARTLLWDLDPQGAATFYFRVAPKVKGGGRKLVSGRRVLADVVRESDWEGLDILPADFSYRNLDLFLDEREQRHARMTEMLAPLAAEYDNVLLDCAPNISLVSENVFEASDYLLSPTIPTTLSMRTLAQLMKHLKKRKGGQRPQVLPFFSMVDRRKTLHRETVEWVRSEGLGFLATEIPYSSQVERMGELRAPVVASAPRSAPALAFAELWREVCVHAARGLQES